MPFIPKDEVENCNGSYPSPIKNKIPYDVDI
jgi:hypothetical protein